MRSERYAEGVEVGFQTGDVALEPVLIQYQARSGKISYVHATQLSMNLVRGLLMGPDASIKFWLNDQFRRSALFRSHSELTVAGRGRAPTERLSACGYAAAASARDAAGC